jgi:hypothetical protein
MYTRLSTSFWKQLPPKPTDACKNLGPILSSNDSALDTCYSANSPHSTQYNRVKQIRLEGIDCALCVACVLRECATGVAISCFCRIAICTTEHSLMSLNSIDLHSIVYLMTLWNLQQQFACATYLTDISISSLAQCRDRVDRADTLC